MPLMMSAIKPHGWFEPRTSHRLPAYRETATPPEVGTPLATIGEGIRQSAHDVHGVQVGHLALQLGAGPGRQLLQYLLENVAGMPHIVEGTAAARAVGVLGIQGPPPRRLQERLITPQREGGSAGEDVIVARETLHSMYCQAGRSGESVDPTRRRVLPDARTMVLGAQGARPSTRHRPFGMRSCPSSCRPHAYAARDLRDSPQTWTDARLCRVRGRHRGGGGLPLPGIVVGRQVAVAAAAARPAWRPEKRQPPRKVPSRER